MDNKILYIIQMENYNYRKMLYVNIIWINYKCKEKIKLNNNNKFLIK